MLSSSLVFRVELPLPDGVAGPLDSTLASEELKSEPSLPLIAGVFCACTGSREGISADVDCGLLLRLLNLARASGCCLLSVALVLGMFGLLSDLVRPFLLARASGVEV